MHSPQKFQVLSLIALLAGGVLQTVLAAPQSAPPDQLGQAGEQLRAQYASTLATLREEIAAAVPVVSGQKKAALQSAREAVQRATADAQAAQQPLDKVKSAQGLVEHAKGKWIGGAEKGIAQAQAALKAANTEAEREAAKNDLARWEANKAEGLQALKERQAALDKAKADAAQATQASKAAQESLAKARATERAAANALLADLDRFLSSETLDAKLVKATILTEATPRGLAEFAQQSREHAALVEKLLADHKLMKDMLMAGGAEYGKYGRAMEIYTAIQKASPKANSGALQRLALATSLKLASPIKQSNPQNATDAPATVDPVKRYFHYEKAFLAGELDPAFKDLTTWEYRHVVDCDAPDEILAWGREMLRTYRPDHITNPNYGWRYVSAVKTEVKYGSQDVGNDLPSLQSYQNIPMNGGVCGRRAFFGRFILKSFGIPTWGVTQHKHAALSHWTPTGWVVNLGAGFNASWWDKDDTALSGAEFLLETQAREHAKGYPKVLRARWVSRVLGEPAYSERKKQEGGFWSNVGRYQAIAVAAQAVELGPLGQELGEANESPDKEKFEHTQTSESDKRPVLNRDGTITVPAVANRKPTGPFSTMPSHAGGLQIHARGGFKTEYLVDAPQAGKYALTARVATLQTGQEFEISVNGDKEPAEVGVPHTIGLWKSTPPVQITLARGQNVLNFAIRDGSRGVSIKDFTLTPIK